MQILYNNFISVDMTKFVLKLCKKKKFKSTKKIFQNIFATHLIQENFY